MKLAGGLFTALVYATILGACGSQPGASNGGASGQVSETADGRAVTTERMDALDRMDDTCGMEPVKAYLGTQASDIPASDLPQQVRILTPTSQATLDYVPRRLNILTNEDGMVIGLKCG